MNQAHSVRGVNIGTPEREYVIEPLVEPVPEVLPVEPANPEPVAPERVEDDELVPA